MSLTENRCFVVTYIYGDIVIDDELLLGDAASLGSRGDAKSASLGDRVWAHGGVGRVHVLRKHRILIQFRNSIKTLAYQSGCLSVSGACQSAMISFI